MLLSDAHIFLKSKKVTAERYTAHTYQYQMHTCASTLGEVPPSEGVLTLQLFIPDQGFILFLSLKRDGSTKIFSRPTLLHFLPKIFRPCLFPLLWRPLFVLLTTHL